MYNLRHNLCSGHDSEALDIYEDEPFPRVSREHAQKTRKILQNTITRVLVIPSILGVLWLSIGQ